MVWRIEAGAAGRDAALRRNAGHLGSDEASAALGALGIVDEMPIRGATIDRLVLGHWRDHDAVVEQHVAQTEGREHRRPARVAIRLGLKPVFGATKPLAVAQPQVFMRDALAAGQERIGELRRRQVEIALHTLEPFEAVAGRRLQPQDLDPAFILITPESLFQCRFGMQVFGKCYGAVEGEA